MTILDLRRSPSLELFAVKESMSYLVKPFRFARAPRHEDGAVRAGCPREHDLVRHPLIETARRFGGEKIRLGVPMLVGRAGGSLRVGPVKDPEREQPQDRPR